MSLNQSLNISVGSMINNQYALTVVSQNIANMNVEGYHKQRVDFQTNKYTTSCKDVISTIKGMNGASIASLSDYYNEGAFKNKIDANSDAQYYNTLADALSGLEDIADDLGDNGLSALLNDFYTASANLEQFPADLATREQFAQKALAVCEKFNAISQKYDDVINDKEFNINNDISTVNNLIEQLARANAAHIQNNQSSATQSQIDSILEQLSNYVNVTTTKNDNGSYNLYFGDVAVVEGSKQKFELEAVVDNTAQTPVKLQLRSTENPDFIRISHTSDLVTSGSLKASMDFINGSPDNLFTSVREMKSAIDEAAFAFADELNKIQLYDDNDVFAASIKVDNTGELILEKAQKPLFTSKDGGTFNAGNITLNPEVMDNPYYISAARIDLKKYTDENGNIDPNWVKSIGNSDNAVEMTALQNKPFASLNGVTISQYLSTIAAKNGNEIAGISKKADVCQNIADSAASNYANLIGVNLDEELADMLRYQRAFEASARLVATVNDLMGTIIGMV